MGCGTPFPGDQPLSFLRQTAFPAHPSVRSMTAPTAGLGAASTPCASPTSPVSPTAPTEPGLQGGRVGSPLITTLAGAPKQRLLVPLSLQTIPQAPKLPSLPFLGMPQPYRHPEGMGAVFFMCGTPQTELLCCPTDPDTGISDAEQYHTYSELTNPQDPLSKDQWDDLGSSTSPCSQASDDEAKTGSPVKAEPFPTPKKDDFALPSLSLITTSAGNTEVGKQGAESSQSYTGTQG